MSTWFWLYVASIALYVIATIKFPPNKIYLTDLLAMVFVGLVPVINVCAAFGITWEHYIGDEEILIWKKED